MTSKGFYFRQSFLILASLLMFIGIALTLLIQTVCAQDNVSKEQHDQMLFSNEANTSFTSPSEQNISPKLSELEVKPKASRRNTKEDLLLMEGAIVLYSSVSFIEGGSKVMGWLFILSSPLAFNGKPEGATYEEPVVAFASFIAVGSYNIYMDKQKMRKSDMFRHNLIAMNLAALSIAAAHIYGHPVEKPKKAKTDYNVTANADGIYGVFNYHW